MHEISDNTKVTAMLCAPLLAGGGRDDGLLTPKVLRTLLQALADRGLEPASLLDPDILPPLLADNPSLEGERIAQLLTRGFALASAVEHWHSRGIWLISRFDEAYPAALIDRLGDHAPPLLYGCGELSALKPDALAIVGSRDASEEMRDFTREVGERCASAGVTVVSGGARGIDQCAMSAALMAGGRAVGVLADKLERAAVERDNRQPLMDGTLLLLSPLDPAAGFHVGQAMGRNKYIYALARAGLVVNADLETGGTWNGAIEVLKGTPAIPLFVRSTGSPNPALDALRAKGAQEWGSVSSADDLHEKLSAEAAVALKPARAKTKGSAPDMFARPAAASPSVVKEHSTPTSSPAPESREPDQPSPPAPETEADAVVGDGSSAAAQLFQHARSVLLEVLSEARTEKDLANELDLVQAQLKAWLARLLASGEVEKKGRPVKWKRIRPALLLGSANPKERNAG